MEELLAKKNPNESLISHTNWVLLVWDIIFQQYKSIIPDNRFWDDSYISVLLHDIGKVVLNFQDVMYNRVRNNDNYIRHELYSGVFILLNNKDRFVQNPLPVLCVFSHHKNLIEGVFDRENDYVDITFNRESLDFIIGFYQDKLQKKGIVLSFDNNVIAKLSNQLKTNLLINTFKNLLNGTAYKFD